MSSPEVLEAVQAELRDLIALRCGCHAGQSCDRCRNTQAVMAAVADALRCAARYRALLQQLVDHDSDTPPEDMGPFYQAAADALIGSAAEIAQVRDVSLPIGFGQAGHRLTVDGLKLYDGDHICVISRANRA